MKYSAGRKNVVKGCVSHRFNHATFDQVFFASRVRAKSAPELNRSLKNSSLFEVRKACAQFFGLKLLLGGRKLFTTPTPFVQQIHSALVPRFLSFQIN